MGHFPKIVLGVFAASVAGSLVASQLFSSPAALWLGAPALIMSGWAAIGHLVTIDDDSPGGWSNQESSDRTWHRSLRDLSIKLAVFIAVGWVVVFLPAG